MKTEIKICLPMYKVVCSIFFIIILSLVRGIGFSYEIGIAMEAQVAFLTIVFCADLYLSERLNKRGDIFGLYSVKSRTKVIRKRVLIQVVYLTLISVCGYWLFLVKCPLTESVKSECVLFLMFIAAIAMTICFWGMLSMTISNLLHNMWIGMCVSLILWLCFNSSWGSKTLGEWGIFSYTFRGIEHLYDWNWLYGKIIPMILVMVMLLGIPTILKKRG